MWESLARLPSHGQGTLAQEVNDRYGHNVSASPACTPPKGFEFNASSMRGDFMSSSFDPMEAMTGILDHRILEDPGTAQLQGSQEAPLHTVRAKHRSGQQVEFKLFARDIAAPTTAVKVWCEENFGIEDSEQDVCIKALMSAVAPAVQRFRAKAVQVSSTLMADASRGSTQQPRMTRQYTQKLPSISCTSEAIATSPFSSPGPAK